MFLNKKNSEKNNEKFKNNYQNKENFKNLSGGQIAGITIAAILGFIILLLLIFGLFSKYLGLENLFLDLLISLSKHIGIGLLMLVGFIALGALTVIAIIAMPLLFGGAAKYSTRF